MKINQGEKVKSSMGVETGITTGHTRHCQMHGCNGIRIDVRWPDGKLTRPCSKGMDYKNGEWQIL